MDRSRLLICSFVALFFILFFVHVPPVFSIDSTSKPLQQDKTSSFGKSKTGKKNSSSKNEKSRSPASKSILPQRGYCCVQGELQFDKTEKQCSYSKGRFYSQKGSRRAKKTCQPEKGYCCIEGKLQSKITKKVCKYEKGKYYEKRFQSSVKKECVPTGSCCLAGKLISGMTERQCRNKLGSFYTNSKLFKARKACRTKGYCCVDGKLLSEQKTKQECKKEKGTYFQGMNRLAEEKKCRLVKREVPRNYFQKSNNKQLTLRTELLHVTGSGRSSIAGFSVNISFLLPNTFEKSSFFS